MRTFILSAILLMSSFSAHAQDTGLFAIPCTHGGALHLTECAVFASAALDTASSYMSPGVEVGPLQPGGEFGWRQASIVMGSAYGWIVLQRYLIRKQPSAARWAGWINIGVAAGHGYAAAHNWRLQQ